ncbi:two-component system, sensor histidine kinase YesM [Cohnella sp. OV330]|nr:two-component system, sensor histidine kinase YesM [Cohnella sp. OV330]
MQQQRSAAHQGRMSIHQRITLYFAAALSLIIIALAVSNYRISSAIFIDKAVDSTRQSLDLVSGRLDLVFDNAQNDARIAIQNQTIQQTLIAASQDGDSYSDYQRYIAVQNVLGSIADGQTYVSAIVLYDNRHRIYDSGGLDGIRDISRPYFERFAESAYGIAWQGTESSNYYRDNRQVKVVSLFQRFNSQMSGAQLGVLQLSVEERYLSQQYASVKLGDTGRVFIVDAAGNVVSSADPNDLNVSARDEPYYPLLAGEREGRTFVQNGERYLVVSRPYPRMGWSIAGIVPIGEITKDKSALTTRFTLLGFLFVLLAMLATPLLSRSAMRPLKVIKQTVKRVQRGDLDVSLDLYSRDEIGELAVEFNRMVSRTKSLMERSVEEEKRRKEFELAAIQAQINPHFLYNTLESICGLAELGRNADIIDLVGQLAGFYRGVLSKGNPIITLGEELALTQRYLDILKVRYADKLDYAIDVDSAMLECRTLKLLLQPLVENSIYHGLKNKRGKGMIRILGKIRDGKMMIEVRDDGTGMTPEKAKALLLRTGDEQSASFGVKSAHERIKLYFGPEFGLELESEPGTGTAVTITLPLQRPGGNEP